MPLPVDFQNQLTEKSDAELYDIVINQGDYLPEAVAAAKEELNRRNLPPEKVNQLQQSAEARKSQENIKAETGLPWYVKVFILIGFFPVVWFAIVYEGRGYKKKANQCWAWAGFSLIFWLLIGVLGALSRF